jgi:thiamine biosynthesis lipoprotein
MSTTVPAGASWRALGTTAQLLVTDANAFARARAVVDAELAAIDRACSRFREDSELSRLNATQGVARIVTPLLLEAVQAGLRAAQLTGGIVDPTVGGALILAGYDRDFGALGRADTPLRAVRVAGWRAVSVDPVRRRIRLESGVSLDLGATAKALAADRCAAAAAGVVAGGGALVSLGGDVSVAGDPPVQGWRVGVADSHLAAPGDPGQAVVVLRSGGLATSSTTVRRWGTGRHHIIDPSTGLPATGCWRTASVAAASCVDANTASTAAIVLGARAAQWLGDRGMPGRLVDHRGDVATVAGWPEERVAA